MSRKLCRRKCRHCNEYFLPDPRCADRQRYCFKPGCRHASKTTSQRNWQSKDGNGDYHRGPKAVERVQAWRQAHPGYWRRKRPPSGGTQPSEEKPVNTDQSSCNAASGLTVALQDDCLTQTAAFIGLISMFTGYTLQEDIAITTRQLLLRGRNILGTVSPEISLTNSNRL